MIRYIIETATIKYYGVKVPRTIWCQHHDLYDNLEDARKEVKRIRKYYADGIQTRDIIRIRRLRSTGLTK